MPTLYGPWEGGSVKGRIRIEYTRTYINNNTGANFAGDIYIEFDASISDSTNTWSVTGDGPNSSGSNLAISFGSGGGKKKIRSFNNNVNEYQFPEFTINTSVSNLEAIGTTVNASLSFDMGNLAPFLNNSNYTAGSITSNGAVISGISANDNGSGLADVQVEYNTSPSDSGAAYKSLGVWATSVSLAGLLYRATTYYYRVRPRNNGYGWGDWGAWKSFTTLSTIPGVPASSWFITNITQTSADVNGLSADNGGSAIDMWLARVNTAPQETSGFSDFTVGGAGPSVLLTGLVPGTLYYVKLWVHNANGWNADPTWKSFTTLPGVSVNVGGVWKSAQPWVNVGGIWKPAVRYVNVGGVWKQ